MSASPFMPLWVADFMADTMDLDAKEVGAYMLILMALWGRDGYLPNDSKKLQRVARCGREWPKVWGSIQHYFTTDGDRITQDRLMRELQKVAAKREVNAQTGSLGGRAKSLKIKERAIANATKTLQQPEPELEREDSEANASDGAAVVSVDFAKAIFTNGVKFLCGHGVKELQARAVIGKWRKDHPDPEIFDAFAACAKSGAIDPIPWITARLAPRFTPQFDPTKFEERA